MDEIEARLAALELLVMERLAQDPPAVLRMLAEQLRQESYGDEALQRAQAVAIVDDAIRRFDEFTTGFVIRGRDKP